MMASGGSTPTPQRPGGTHGGALHRRSHRHRRRKNGRAWSSDGAIDVQINPPKEVGGSGEGTNPEQLFAAGYAACFDNALHSVARMEKITPARPPSPPWSPWPSTPKAVSPWTSSSG